LAVRKQEVQKFDVKSFNLRKLNELELRKLYDNDFSSDKTFEFCSYL
jgi:hypothetical protein